jgi:hypothetical protein
VPPDIGEVSVVGLTDVLLATANSVTFTVRGSSAQGEALQASWSFGDSTTNSAAVSNGAASVTKTYANAGVFTPRVTVSAPRGGGVSRDYQAITVGTVTGVWTGRFSNGSFVIMNLTQNGAQVTGEVPENFARDQIRASGTVSGPPSTLRFRLTYGDGGFFEINATGSSDQRTFTGTVLTGVGTQPFSMTKQ